jgi:hypothetical protein
MEIFAYTPGGPESLKDFNGRVEEWCRENPTIGVLTSIVKGGGLVISATQAEDVPAHGGVAYMPIVYQLRPEELSELENVLTNILDELRAASTDETSVLPVETRTLSEGDVTYAVVIVNIGEIEDETLDEEPARE